MTDKEKADKAWKEVALEMFKKPWVEVAREMYELGLKAGREEKIPDEYEWNLYHDMDNRSYNDVEKIKKLEKALQDIENTAVCVSIADPVELLQNIIKTTEQALK